MRRRVRWPLTVCGLLLEALKDGEVDCVFPANLDAYDGEQMGMTMTPPIMRTEIYAVVREEARDAFARKDTVTVAVNQGNTNYVKFLEEHFPGWQPQYYEDTPTGLQAVAVGEVDCLLISNYRYNDISRECDQLGLTTLVTGIVRHLRQKGFTIELDDFGSGYSSLNMLSTMPIDVLKMDKGFIQNIGNGEMDIRLVKLILDIAKDLRVPVVAEGVEDEAQLALLKQYGCALAQGYYFSRPLSADDFERWLADCIANGEL